MIRVRVNRVNIQAKLAEGYTFAKGDGPDGRLWLGDTVVMEISEDRFERLQRERRAGYEQLQRALASGEMPLEMSEPGVEVKFTVQDGREAQLSSPRRSARSKEA